MANMTIPLVQTVQAEEVKELPVEEQIAEQAKEAGLDPKLAVKIAYCESTWRHFDPKTGGVLRGVHNPADVGIFQINESYHLAESQKLGYDIYRLEGNIGYALHLMKKEGLRHWQYSKPCWNKNA